MTIGPEASLWPGAVLRGDVGPIVVGARSNIQDNTVVHCTGGRSPMVVGDRVTVGHSAILHGCQIGDDCLIGMGALIMDDSVIAPFCLVAAGSLIPPGKIFPEGVLILGRPAKVVRALTEKERQEIAEAAGIYVDLAAGYPPPPSATQK